jgi:membrane protein
MLKRLVIPRLVIVRVFSRLEYQVQTNMHYFFLLYHAGREWVKRDMSYYAAAFSYYAPLALIPLLSLSLATAGTVYDSSQVISIFQNWGTVLGDDLLSLVNIAVQNLDIEIKSYSLPTVAIVFFTSASVFAFNVLGTGFQRLWNSHHGEFSPWYIQTLRSILFVFILQAYLIFIVGFEVFLASFDLAYVSDTVWFLTISILFYLLYRYLVHKSPSWHGCLVGSLVAGILFLLVKNLVSIYLAHEPVLSIFGAAGLILVLLVWIYVLASIILYGASIAHIYDRMGHIK